MGNLPVWYGEWSLATQFNATDDFLCKWADAQKLTYSQGAGWLVRSSFFKTRKIWFYTSVVLEFQNRTNEHLRATVVKYIPTFDGDEAQRWLIGPTWKG
jgi:hypothetical protein